MQRICLLLLPLVLLATRSSFALSSACSQEDTAHAAQQVDAARKTLLALPIGDGLQTDVSLAAQTSIAAMKARLEALLIAYMQCAPAEIEAPRIAKDLSSMSHAFALEKRSYTNDELPKEANNYGFQLEFHARREPASSNLIGITAGFQIECGWDTVLAVFERDGNSWKPALEWTSKPYKTVAGGFWAFDYGISPARSGQWFVVTKFINPWCSSTWSSIHYSVLRPSHSGLDPVVLYSGSDSIWWGNDDEGTLSVDADRFDLRFHAESIDGGIHNRVWIRDFSVTGDEVKRVPPVAVSPRDFVDEWIISPWKYAAEWSVPTKLAALRSAHDQVKKSGAGEFDSVHKCTDDPSHYQVALAREDGRILYFQVVGPGQNYKMDRVGTSPEAQCDGPDLLDSMATK